MHNAFGCQQILQRAPYPASIWGYAPAGAQVKVAIASGDSETTIASVTTTTAASGKWRASLPPQPASTAPVKITATSGSQTLTLSDVLFGGE